MSVAMAAGALLVRAIWWVFVGWWLSGLAMIVACIACITIVDLPAAFTIFRAMPLLLTLRRSDRFRTVDASDSRAYLDGTGPRRPGLVRLAWFILVGWWAAPIALFAAWLLCVVPITWPVTAGRAVAIFNRIGTIMTLTRGVGGRDGQGESAP